VAAGRGPGLPVDGVSLHGSRLYAAAGLLQGRKTTTHWGFRDNLRALGVEVVADRVVWQGNHISGAGVSAGIAMALARTERVLGRKLAESLQLTIEYDPQPRSTPAPRPRPMPARSAWPYGFSSATARCKRRRGSTTRARQHESDAPGRALTRRRATERPEN
jgi:transcriptional regulator GlxA family with amidase domain